MFILVVFFIFSFQVMGSDMQHEDYEGDLADGEDTVVLSDVGLAFSSEGQKERNPYKRVSSPRAWRGKKPLLENEHDERVEETEKRKTQKGIEQEGSAEDMPVPVSIMSSAIQHDERVKKNAKRKEQEEKLGQEVEVFEFESLFVPLSSTMSQPTSPTSPMSSMSSTMSPMSSTMSQPTSLSRPLTPAPLVDSVWARRKKTLERRNEYEKTKENAKVRKWWERMMQSEEKKAFVRMKDKLRKMESRAQKKRQKEELLQQQKLQDRVKKQGDEEPVKSEEEPLTSSQLEQSSLEQPLLLWHPQHLQQLELEDRHLQKNKVTVVEGYAPFTGYSFQFPSRKTDDPTGNPTLPSTVGNTSSRDHHVPYVAAMLGPPREAGVSTSNLRPSSTFSTVTAPYTSPRVSKPQPIASKDKYAFFLDSDDEQDPEADTANSTIDEKKILAEIRRKTNALPDTPELDLKDSMKAMKDAFGEDNKPISKDGHVLH